MWRRGTGLKEREKEKERETHVLKKKKNGDGWRIFDGDGRGGRG